MFGRKIIALPGEISTTTCNPVEKSAEVIVLTVTSLKILGGLTRKEGLNVW